MAKLLRFLSLSIHSLRIDIENPPHYVGCLAEPAARFASFFLFSSISRRTVAPLILTGQEGWPASHIGSGMVSPCGENSKVHQPDPKALELAREFRRRVAEILGPRLIEVRLFGSRARGEARPDSDLDLFVLVDRADRATRNLVTDQATDLNLERGFDPYLSALIMDREEFDFMTQRQRRLVHDVAHDGIAI